MKIFRFPFCVVGIIFFLVALILTPQETEGAICIMFSIALPSFDLVLFKKELPED